MPLFLRQYAQPHQKNVRCMAAAWLTLLGHSSSTEDFVVPLYTIVEDVRCTQCPYCDHCRSAGWGHHFVSKTNYHLIIPEADHESMPLVDDFPDLQTHRFHGLIHCNGFGHLLSIKGTAGGSKYLDDKELMNLWDRICINLRTRKITVKDLSRKSSMYLRLLYGVGYGHSWHGKWGYKFCRGSFGVAELDYFRAIKDLSSLQLDQIVKDFGDTDKCREIKQIFRHYKDMSETPLMTLKDLLGFMLTIKSYAPLHINKKATAAPSCSTSKPLVIANMEDGKWSAKRLGEAAEVIATVLKEENAEKLCHGKMTRHDLRAAARVHIGDTGLLDHVLSLDNVDVGTHVVCRTKNPRTRIFEFSLHELGNGIKASEPDTEVLPNPLSEPALQPGVDVYQDLDYLYSNILVDYPGSDWVNEATWVVLNSKYFVKEWPLLDENDQFLTFTCRLMRLGETETKMENGLPPGEVVVDVSPHATVGELKQAVENAAKNTYCIAENFKVTNIEELEGFNDETFLSEAVASGIDLCVTGIRLALENRFRCQAGIESWEVRCTCGATDYDGEKMIACNVCRVRKHTHCCGMKDTEVIPQVYICKGCEVSISLHEEVIENM
ncbi:hypothetical protein FH972_010455 [Carpinus fangiana]|uniref:Zinc finger PHD-type domain-containing protein n=1 Tax=Carpinus fangiana TaxID=176857 RepID=A0A660KNE2_9ROSI|nr:hypothetical protein FH972_010455 [Carpinus fangiana]